VNAYLNRKVAQSEHIPESNPAESYFMDDKREAERLASKVNAPKWVEKYLGPHLRSGMSVLDVGCGPGVIANSAAIAYPNSRFVGVDISAQRLKQSPFSATPNLELKSADVFSLPFSNECFDLVYCRFLLEYLQSPQLAINEMCRVLKPGGSLLLQDLDGQLVWHYPEDEDLQRNLNSIVTSLQATGFDPFVGRKLFNFAQLAGLDEIEVNLEKYHLYPGQIDRENESLWTTKLEIALPTIEKILGNANSAQKLTHQFLDYLRRKDTLTYSVIFTVLGKKGSHC